MTGFLASFTWAFSTSAVRVGSVIACGVRMTSRPSLFSSAAAIVSACA
jgi:hypothetical protein